MRYLKYSGVLFFAVLLHLYLYHADIIKNLDDRIYDMLSNLTSKEISKNNEIIVVDIDDESLKKFGSWPWPRIVNAKLINQISLMKPKSIGINLIFSAKDRTSPVNIQNFYQKFFNYKIEMPNLPQSLKDNDLLLQKSIFNSKSTLSLYILDKQVSSSCEDLNFSAYQFSNIYSTLKVDSLLCNYHLIQNKNHSFGFVNSRIDSDGLLRRMPLFINYEDKILPSFALAVLLNIAPLKPLEEKNSFSILGHTVFLDKNAFALLDFNSKLPQVVSARSILDGEVSPSLLKDKIVLVGSSVKGLKHSRLLANHQKISNTMIHALLIQNILEDRLISQPDVYKQINFFLSLFFSFLVVLFLFKRWYILILILFVGVTLLSATSLLSLYFHNIYISIGYLWIPFLDFFFIMNISFILLHAKAKEKSEKELLRSHSATVDTITLIASMHDDETGAHILRTKNYVKILAEHFYSQNKYMDILSEEYINTMYEAAPLHDIGKIGIPDAILKKKGKLTKEEFEVMKTHSTLGKNVIKNTLNVYDKNDFLKVAYNIAFYHHEKWDGTGYPNGLKGDEIPLEAQFMTLADVYDALISKRCYKEAYSFEKAEEIILEGEGTVYSPELIKAFRELKEEFKKIALRWKDSI